jgi:hypothetical protein
MRRTRSAVPWVPQCPLLPILGKSEGGQHDLNLTVYGDLCWFKVIYGDLNVAF